MPAAQIALPGSRALPRKTWTIAEYVRLHDANYLAASPTGETPRYELLEGEIIAVMPQKRKHLVACMRVQALLMAEFGIEFIQSQGPVALDEKNLPEPDVAVLLNPVSDYAREPKASDVRLLVEVSDTTLRTDLSLKAALYARAGVPEYWVLDVSGRQLRVHTQPTPTGYASVVTLSETQSVFAIAAPSSALLISSMLPPL